MSLPLLFATILIIGLLTFGLRLSFLVFLGQAHISPMLKQALRFVPIAVLSALIAPALFLPQGTLDLAPGNSRLIAGIIATLVAWRTKNVLLTIVVGIVCLLVLQMLLPGHS